MSEKKKSLKDLYKSYKINPANYLENTVMADYAVITISPQIDMTCGGGIREGSLVLVSGHEKLGKSTFCLQAAANAQNMDDGIKRKIYYFDVENKILPRDLEGIHNLNYKDAESFEVIGSSDEGPIPAEAYFNLAENIVINQPHSIIIFDSFSMLLTSSELAYNFDDNKMRPDVPGYTSIFCKKMCQLLRPSRSILFGINHVYTSQGTGPAILMESGGKKIQYAGNYKFRLVSKTPIEKDGAIIGNTVSFQCVYHPSDMGSSPKEKLEFIHRFKYGIDDINDILELSILFGLLEQKGAWITHLDSGEKWQGKENAREALVNNKKLLGALRKAVRQFTS